MYLAKFDTAGKPTSFLRPGVNIDVADVAAKIADGYVEISDDDHAYYVGNRGTGDNSTGYVRGSDGKPTSAAAVVVTKEDKAETTPTNTEPTLDERISVLEEIVASQQGV